MHWIRNVEVLARDFMILVPDLPGSGDSTTPPPPISADSIAAFVTTGLNEIIGSSTSFSVVGFSMGGLIAGYVVGQCAGRVDHLVLVGASGTLAPRNQLKLQSWRLHTSEADKIEAHRANLGVLMIRDQDKIDALAIFVQRRNAELSRIRGKHVSSTGALSKCLSGFGGRLAGIWGEEDAIARTFLGERHAALHALSPDATFDVFPGVSHWVQYEAHEKFNLRLRELLLNR
jgi:pimeloyl-ACP methyl ester carboxylesterase